MFRITCAAVGVVATLYGLSYTFLPFTTASLYLPEANAQAALLGRYFGLTLLFVGVACWFLREITDPAAKRAVVIAGLVNAVTGVVVSVVFTLNGGMTAMGWSAVVIYVLTGAGWLMSWKDTLPWTRIE